MKHILLFILLLLAGLRPVSAQPTGSDSLSQKLAAIFAHIDKSQVPTGYLYEAGIRFLEPRYYNGVLGDSNRTDMDVLRYLRAQMRSSRVYGADTLPTLPGLNARIKAATAAAGGAIPVAVQYLPYASIKPRALQDNLLTVQNEQVYDVAGRPQSPYQTNVLFAAAPDLAYARTNTVAFLFRRNLYLAADGAVPSLYLDFGDGRGYQPVAWGQPLATTYATAGTKHVKVKALFKTPRFLSNAATQDAAQPQLVGGTVSYESHFDFEVQAVVPAARYGDNGGFSQYIGFTRGYRTGATVTVKYGRGHGPHVVKPFVVVEQYNIAGVAPHLVRCNNANNTAELFLDKIGPANTGGYDFDTQLEAAGYDLIYIDFEHNTDDIAVNAEVLELVLREVNAWKRTSQTQFGYPVEQNVVMGMSMGGLVARYALAAMTKTPLPYGPPDTRLLVLHDSPQRGAYNPVGLQSFARSCDVPLNLFEFWKVRDLKGEIDDAIVVLDQPATQQLAILSAYNGRGDIRANTFIDGDYAAMVDFTRPANASGPQPTYRMVATSDGAQCGQGSGAPLGVQLSSADTFTSPGVALALFLRPLSYLSRFSLGVRGAAYGLPAYGQRATISRMRVYIEYRLGIGVCPFCLTIPIRFDLLNESALSPPNTLPYETLPGGTTNLYAESGDCSIAVFPSSLFLRTSLYNGPICFVPSSSALDVPTMTPATAFAKYINNATDNLSFPRAAPFVAASSAEGYNLRHLTFTPRNSEWIFNEMQSLPNLQACSSECSPFAIVASGFVSNPCPGTNVTLTVPNLPSGATVAWTALSGTVTSGTGATFVTQPDGSGSPLSGNATITTAAGCGFVLYFNISTTPIEGTFGFSPPQPLVPVSAGAVNTVRDPYATIVFATEQGVSYTFTVQSGSQFAYFRGFDYDADLDFNSPNQVVRINITKTTTSCGTVTQAFDFVWDPTAPRSASDEKAASAARTAALYPNPARETVDVHVDNADAAHPVAVRLFDGYGRPCAEQASTGAATVRLNTEKLPAGLYFVHILRGGKVLSRQQLRIEH